MAAGFALLFMANRGLFDLGVLMFRIDLFAFGGGFASVPLMYHEIVDVRSWMDGETFMNGIALGQVTPGPIVITATFVGYLLYGIAGAVGLSRGRTLVLDGDVTPLLVVAAAGFALLFLANRGLFNLGVLMSRIDLFAFGGGFASVPLDVPRNRGCSLVDGRARTFMNGIALGQVTPGPIVITATFVGILAVRHRGSGRCHGQRFPALIPDGRGSRALLRPLAGVGPFQSVHVWHTCVVCRIALVGDNPIRSGRAVGCTPNRACRRLVGGVALQRGCPLGRSGGRCGLSGDFLAARLDQHLPHTAMAGVVAAKTSSCYMCPDEYLLSYTPIRIRKMPGGERP